MKAEEVCKGVIAPKLTFQCFYLMECIFARKCEEPKNRWCIFWQTREKSAEFISPLLMLIAPCFLSLVSAQAVGQGQLQSMYVTV